MKLRIPLLITVSAILVAGCDRHQPRSLPAPRTFTEQDVTDFVTRGRSRDEIVTRFGLPGFEMTNGVADVTMFYNLPLPNPVVRQTFAFAGFQVRITNGVVADWSAIHQDIR
jgi:hypothetical protein